MEFDRNELSRELMKDFNDDEYEFGAKRDALIPLKILVPMIVVAALGFVGYAWYNDSFAISNETTEVPLIRADTGSVRERPIDPGGMTIANRDKSVYEAIDSDKDKALPNVIRLMPEPEEPVAREDIANQGRPAVQEAAPEVVNEPAREQWPTAENKAIAPVVQKDLAKINEEDFPDSVANEIAKTVEEKTKPVIKASADEPKLITKTELLSKDLNVPNDVEELTVDNIKFAPVPVKRHNQEVVTKADNGYKIQLGSFRTEQDVSANWAKIKKAHTSLLGKLELYTEKAELGDKGVFYRLQLGGLSKESEARQVCNKLIEAKQGCFVVKK